jgi:hypothetical protein
MGVGHFGGCGIILVYRFFCHPRGTVYLLTVLAPVRRSSQPAMSLARWPTRLTYERQTDQRDRRYQVAPTITPDAGWDFRCPSSPPNLQFLLSRAVSRALWRFHTPDFPQLYLIFMSKAVGTPDDVQSPKQAPILGSDELDRFRIAKRRRVTVACQRCKSRKQKVRHASGVFR